MPSLKELTNRQINEVLLGAVEKYVPLRLTVRFDERWLNLRSRPLALEGGHFVIELPVKDDGVTPHQLVPGEKVGLSFKLKHYKHLCSATVAGPCEMASREGGDKVAAVRLCCPSRMQRLQRRAYMRVDIPPNRIVRASVWLGGRNTEPAGTSADQPVWSGQVVNLSAGGFKMRASQDAIDALEINDPVGVRLVFSPGEQAVYADAQFRHAEQDGESCLMGFQFVGLGRSREGQASLSVIVEKVNEFLRPGRRALLQRRS